MNLGNNFVLIEYFLTAMWVVFVCQNGEAPYTSNIRVVYEIVVGDLKAYNSFNVRILGEFGENWRNIVAVFCREKGKNSSKKKKKVFSRKFL